MTPEEGLTLTPGTPVVYHAHAGARREDGVVIRHAGNCSGRYVFVRYADQHPDADGKLTPTSALTLTHPNNESDLCVCGAERKDHPQEPLHNFVLANY